MKLFLKLSILFLIGNQMGLSQQYFSNGLFNNNSLFPYHGSSDKISTGLEIGSSFTSFSKSFSFLNSYINPSVNFKINPKLDLKTGLFIVNSSVLNAPSVALPGSYISDFRTMMTYFYAQTQYRINEKFRISGQVMYGNNKNSPFSNHNSRKIDYSYSLSADYKISNSLQIGIQVRNTQVNSPYLWNQNGYNSFGNQQYNPFGYSNLPNNW